MGAEGRIKEETGEVIINSDMQITTPTLCPAHRLSQQFQCGRPGLDGVLNGLDLHGHRRQHRLLQPVELIKATPRPTLDQPHKDSTHGLDVDALVTVEHQHLAAEQTAQRLDRLCLPCACRAVGVATKTHLHTWGDRQV